MCGESVHQKFLPYLRDLLRVGLLALIPAAAGHFGIDIRLHVQTFAQCAVKRLMHVRRGGFDGTVQIQIADALCRQKQVFHNLLIVIHGHPSLNERHQAVEELLVGALKLANALFELRVAERGLGFLTLGDEKLLVAERIVDIKQFFRAHKKTPPAVVWPEVGKICGADINKREHNARARFQQRG